MGWFFFRLCELALVNLIVVLIVVIISSACNRYNERPVFETFFGSNGFKLKLMNSTKFDRDLRLEKSHDRISWEFCSKKSTIKIKSTDGFFLLKTSTFSEQMRKTKIYRNSVKFKTEVGDIWPFFKPYRDLC